MKTMRSSFALALAALALLAASASAAEAPGTLLAAEGTADVIAAALAEHPAKVQDDVKELMTSMNMSASDTHFQRFVSREDGEVVDESMALIKYPTVDNDFYIDFIKIMKDLEENVDHVLLVCGHATPAACLEKEEHEGAPAAHPCGPSDAADPEMANKTGAFCEIINMTTTTDEGEVLVFGAEKLQFLQAAYEDAVAAGETPQVPVIQLEVIKASDLMEIMNLTTAEELAQLADYDYELMENNAAAPAAAGGGGTDVELELSPDEEEGDGDADADAAGPEAATEGEEESPETRRRLNRRLLRVGGGFGSGGAGRMRGGGMRGRGGRGVGNARRGGMGPGSRRNRGMEINQVLGAQYYGNKNHKNHGGQIAYFNDAGSAVNGK